MDIDRILMGMASQLSEREDHIVVEDLQGTTFQVAFDILDVYWNSSFIKDTSTDRWSSRAGILWPLTFNEAGITELLITTRLGSL